MEQKRFDRIKQKSFSFIFFREEKTTIHKKKHSLTLMITLIRAIIISTNNNNNIAFTWPLPPVSLVLHSWYIQCERNVCTLNWSESYYLKRTVVKQQLWFYEWTAFKWMNECHPPQLTSTSFSLSNNFWTILPFLSIKQMVNERLSRKAAEKP